MEERIGKPREWLREKSIVKKVLSKANIIFEVVDARIPLETRNNVVEKLVKEQGKNLFIILNKVDLVPLNFAKDVKSKFQQEYQTFLFSSLKGIGKRDINILIKSLSKENKIYKIGVVGYPNVGKSSLINSLKRKRVAITSSKPGMTRGEQLIKLTENVFLIDTPGIITLEYPEDLALKGSFLPEKLEEPIDTSLRLLDKILANNPESLKSLYKIEPDKDSLRTLEFIGERLNYRLTGGKIDLDRTAKKILWDWLKGNLRSYWY